MTKYKVVGRQKRNDQCVVCGFANPMSLGLEFWELENGELASLTHTKQEHQSYPGRTHGGIISALLDEVIGRAVAIAEPECFGVTVDLRVQFKKPVPLEQELIIVGRIDRNRSRMFEGSGEIYLAANGELLAAGSGRYLKLSPEKICGPEFTLSEDNWCICRENPQPEYIELPY